MSDFSGIHIDPVEVVWWDHSFVFGPYDPSRTATSIRSVGYLVRNGKTLVLAQSLDPDGTPCECLYLMKDQVTLVTHLSEKTLP
jgi:hypothetical protein